ncbi:MAG: domain S-box protein [Chitinophagaceae bacterium]|nr:domain S-box protein [Chitinophagaceae bacterium]
MSFYNTYRPILWLTFLLISFLPEKLKADSKADFYYQETNTKTYKATDILALYKKRQLVQTVNSINLGLNVHNAWLVIKPTTLSTNKFLVFENAHLDVIEAYFYSNDELITIKKTGDQVDFDLRDLNHNFPNLKIPPTTSLIILNIKTEGPMLVPTHLFSLEEYFDYAYKYGIFHWTYFGFIFLILISSFIVLMWLKESIYFYYILCVLGMGIVTAIDYEYTFQYLWPSQPWINEYNIIFYMSSAFSILFSEKLFNTKKELPKLYIVYKLIYASLALVTILLLILPYNTGLQIFFYYSVIIRLFSIATAIVYYIHFRNSTSKFFLLGWAAFTGSDLIYSIYLSGILPFSVLFNNIVQIGSGIQIILFNTAILSTINSLKKEKENLTIEKKEAVIKNEITLNSILNGMLQSVWMVDKNLKIIKWNDRFKDNVKNLLHIDLEESDVNKTVYEIFAEEEINLWIPLYEKVFKGEDIYFEKKYENSGRVIEYYMYPIVINQEISNILVISNDITEKVKIKETAEKNEITTNSILNSIRQSAWMVDKDFKLIKYNDKLAENLKSILNISIESLPDGERVSNLSKFTNSDFWDDKYRSALKGEDIYFQTKWGTSERIFEYQMYPIVVNQEIVSVFVLSNEITEKVKQQEELKLSEEKYRTLSENAPVAILVYEVDENRIVEANAAAINLFKLSKEELFNTDPTQLYPPFQEEGYPSIEEAFRLVDRAMEGEIISYEWIFNDSTGKSIPTQVWLNRLPTQGPRLLRTSIVDITERKNNQKEQKELIEYQSSLIDKIKEHEAGLAALINSTSDYIFSLDTDLNLTEFNDSFKQVISKSIGSELVKGMNLYLFTPPELLAQSRINVAKALSGETAKSVIESITKNGEKRYTDLVYSPIFSEHDKVTGITVIARDITESKQAETELLEINNQIAEYKLMALRSVMNPHFLFNSLNSIQYFVAKNERRLALDYLSLFSTLIRKILNSSVNNTIPLNTEIEILNSYITLEKLRFEGRFDYTITIDPAIETDTIQLPSLLIQPYIENAILHGLMNKAGQGLLKIDISLDDDFLLFIVEDNGIGRKKAATIKESHIIKEKSYGMLLTKQRLEIINKRASVSVHIEDLEDEQQQAAGTRVTVSIKI